MKKLLHVVGARPNFMKLKPVYSALGGRGFDQVLVHTGQHYDENMSKIFFDELNIPKPHINLEVGSASHSVQTAQIMMKLEEVLVEEKPDYVLVYGDINSTLASAVVCSKMHIPLAHVEAGLRSFDRTMPEEINRIITDRVSELLFTPSMDGNENLRNEGVEENKIHLVGNVMIDTLVEFLPRTEGIPMNGYPNEFALITLHRPFNVDDRQSLSRILNHLNRISEKLPIVFPVHPRTRKIIENELEFQSSENFQLTEPLSYLNFLKLQTKASVVITDSGGIQEETTYLGIPCLTLRPNTERPVTSTIGSNMILGNDYELMERQVNNVLTGSYKQSEIPPLWDGKASERIADVFEEI